MAKRTNYDGLLRFRRATEDAAQRAVAEAQRGVDAARASVRAMEATLRAEAATTESDAMLLATQHAAQSRLRSELELLHKALSVAQGQHKVAKGKLTAASSERRAAERLVERALSAGELEARRKTRRDEDEIALISHEGPPVK